MVGIVIERKTWRQLLDAHKPLVLPGAHDALCARLIERAGFQAYVIGGFGLSAARHGLPDIGLIGLGEMAAGVRDIMAASALPVLVDADNGHGDTRNVTHTVETYERLGVSALFLEDQVSPKRCGHFAGKDVIPIDAMERKIRAAAAARHDKELFLIARTDARSVHGLDDALRRAERYIRAGADGLFIEAPRSVEELRTIAGAFDVPQFCNMLVGGQTPILGNQELGEMGFAMIVHGTTLAMSVAKAIDDTLAAIRDDRLDASTFWTLPDFTGALQLERWSDIE
ncbi:MAG TPA: isocitrate lyase/PEP mutase family protein [Aliidongia sp.]|uniref:isocitrate lyase/PEP mutase family protein n=1 Tax=Aliidongia sp. TaxID=1914230 RepID=UPI002DDD58E6|nr:isocitrate lyase/PEP mutase family protein [Aliidongia sp.]HEV2675656.1 isocitrate lyase/PEP mutase family protein [Aliidongia sp.]